MSGYRYFYGWRVVGAAFVLAVFGWGLGFYGPPIYLDTVCRTHGWPVALVGIAVTVHYLAGALVVANLPALYRRFGVPAITKSGAISLALGVAGWALAAEPWQLFVATLFSGAGWVTLAGAALNAIVSPWFNQKRPAALSAAYNGSSIGGVIFSPVWVAVIGLLGFPGAAIAIGMVTVVTIWLLADLFFAKSPGQMGLLPDGEATATAVDAPLPAIPPSASRAAPLEPQILDPRGRHVAWSVRADRSAGASLLAAGSGARPAERGSRYWRRDRGGDCRTHAGQPPHRREERQAPVRLRQLCRADRRGDGVARWRREPACRFCSPGSFSSAPASATPPRCRP